jgi:H+/Cl- antiporter ClcA
MEKKGMYVEIASMIKREKEQEKTRRIDKFFYCFLASVLVLFIEACIFVGDFLKNTTIGHPEYYVWFFLIVIVVFFGFAAYAFIPSMEVSDQDVLYQSKKILKEFKISQNLKQYEIDHPLIVRSKEQLEEYISGLENLLLPIKT